jgi:CheY-like chemotaxis protein
VRARVQLETADKQKDEFLAMLAHELRNPLAPIRNAGEILSRLSLADDRAELAVAIVQRQISALTRLVDDLLDVSRITQGRIELQLQPVNVADVVAQAVEIVEPLVQQRRHRLSTLMHRAVRVHGDLARLVQCVANVLTNAAKYTDRGGTIRLEVSDDAGQVVIAVTDNGIGIPAELQATIFDLFVQGDRSLDRAQGGLGIGLTLVRRIVELHGGTVSAASPGIGGGAEFTIRLPALRHEDAEERQDVRAVTRDRRPARVLMVEDNPDAAESLVMILELLGHHVRVVHDGIAALETARANVPDIMLVDIGLPGMDGYEVARSIRRDTVLKDIVLVALTGYGRPEDRAQALASGFDYHLVKPVDLDALGDLVARLGAPTRAGGPSTVH